MPPKLRVFINGDEKAVPFRSYETLSATVERLLEGLSLKLGDSRVVLANGNSIPLESTLGELWRKNKVKEVRVFNPNYQPSASASSLSTTTNLTSTLINTEK